MRPLLFMMFGSNTAEIRTETVKLSAFWATPASSSGASFFALWSGTKASTKSEGLVTRREGPKKGEKGEAKRLLSFSSSLLCLCANLHRERDVWNRVRARPNYLGRAVPRTIQSHRKHKTPKRITLSQCSGFLGNQSKFTS